MSSTYYVSVPVQSEDFLIHKHFSSALWRRRHCRPSYVMVGGSVERPSASFQCLQAGQHSLTSQTSLSMFPPLEILSSWTVSLVGLWDENRCHQGDGRLKSSVLTVVLSFIPVVDA